MAAPIRPRDFRRLVEVAHRLEPRKARRRRCRAAGRPSPRRPALIGLHLVALDGPDFLVHQRLDLVRVGIADDEAAAGVAMKVFINRDS